MKSSLLLICLVFGLVSATGIYSPLLFHFYLSTNNTHTQQHTYHLLSLLLLSPFSLSSSNILCLTVNITVSGVSSGGAFAVQFHVGI